MHGDDVASIEAAQGIRFAEEVNSLGSIAWTALFNFMARDPENRKRFGTLNLIRTNMHVRQILSLKVHMLVYSSDPQNPKMSELPRPKLEFKVSDRPRRPNQSPNRTQRRL